MEKNLIESEYRAFVTEIKAKVYQSQHQALRQANTFLINLYWEIGKSIVEKQERHGWGKSVVEKLAKDLQEEFPGMDGYSSRNLWRMRMFYQEYRILPPVVAELAGAITLSLWKSAKMPGRDNSI